MWNFLFNLLYFNKKEKTMSNIFYKIHSISFGDTLASTPTLRYLSKSHESKINVVTHNKQVFNQNPYIENLLSFEEYEELKDDNDLIYQSFTYAGASDKNGIEKKFSHIDTRQLHSMDLGFQLDPEDMYYDYYPSPFNLDIVLPEKYVVLHITSNWPNRTWSIENWQKLINWLSDNKIYTILIGSGYSEVLHSSYSDKPLDKICPTFENLYGLDLTNQGSMSDMWWVINKSVCIVTMDSGPLHLAGCTDTTIIQLGSAINPKLRSPYRNGSQEYKYKFVGGTCNIFCNSDLKYNVKQWGDINHVPPQPYCLEDKPTYECHPQIDSVIKVINETLTNLETQNTLKFGIYTSFYNSERFINNIFKTIESINYDKFEWHVTDDFSIDNTKELLLARIEKSCIKEKIKYYEQKSKKEMYWKPNEFFDSTFDWVVLIDSDDDVDPNFLKLYDNILKNRDDLSLITSDAHKIYEDNNNLHSISYIVNEENISTKINRYHPSCDYLNNIHYSCFGLLRGFNNRKVKEFEITNQLACAEDSYRVFWSNSVGKYLHVPRATYKWFLRDDSESHGSIINGFNDNFEGALQKLKQNDFGVSKEYNDVYLETSGLISYGVGELTNTKTTLWSRPLNKEQQDKLKQIYFDVDLKFNEYGSDINIVILNYISDIDLEMILNKIKDTKLLFYYQNQNYHIDNQSKDNEINNKTEYFKKIIQKYCNINWWVYIRHLIIRN